MPTFPVLKAHLNTLFRPKRKSIFNIHDPTGIRCIFQLRVGLSPLRQHKVRHMFADTPTDSCSCGIGTEDTKHFLFSCPLYANQRAILAATVIGILAPSNLNFLANTESLYLYGHHSLSDADNRNIIKATIKYIEESNRFS